MNGKSLNDQKDNENELFLSNNSQYLYLLTKDKMKVETTYDIWDEVTTVLWDVWIITAVSVRWIYTKQIKYCVWVSDDKEQWIEDWQIEKKNWTVLK